MAAKMWTTVWDTEERVNAARKIAHRKVASQNRDRALAGRYGLYKYPKRGSYAKEKAAS